MSYRATFRNGKIVLQDGVQLAEGTELVITTVEEANPPTLGELFADVTGKAKGKPADGSVQHDHYIYGSAKR